jgi:hypothetical protein
MKSVLRYSVAISKKKATKFRSIFFLGSAAVALLLR